MRQPTRRVLAALAITLAGVTLAACGPPTEPGFAFTHDDSYAAIQTAFGQYGPGIVDCANRIADVESGHWPYSDNGSHHGLFQLHDGFWGSIVSAAESIGWPASWYNPYENALAASYAFAQHGTFHDNWKGTAPGDCP